MEPLHHQWMNGSMFQIEKWVKHYSSSHQILLVGDGDFSFSLSLAYGFGSSSNICATSLDTYDEVVEKYSRARSNLEQLVQLGATVLHGVDAKEMMYHPLLNMKKFDRIVFNFPHAGFYGKENDPQVLGIHQNLVHWFFINARQLLQNGGQIHVSHKDESPYDRWKIEELAYKSSLRFIKRVPFQVRDYPFYQNKRGHGPASDDTFRLGKCSTFMFTAMPDSAEMFNIHSNYMNPSDIAFDNQLAQYDSNTFNRAVFCPQDIYSSFSNAQNSMSFSQSPIEKVKFIVKAEVRPETLSAGFAGALLDENHVLLAEFHGPLLCMDSDIAELHAIKYALLMFERSQLWRTKTLILESNSVNAVSWINTHFENPRELQTDLEEITMALVRIQNVEIRCRSSGYGLNQNNFVDRLAEVGLHMERISEAWL